MKQITPLFALESGTASNGQKIFSLIKTHFTMGTQTFPIDKPTYIKAWYDQEPTPEELEHEIMLNDWSRWNTELPKGQEVEISEDIFYHLFGCVPPVNVQQGAKYFECGEIHHHDNNGNPIRRACWIKGGKYYTGYPKKTFSII